ncbi:MAG: alpha/beta hydrolase [Alphaproteobacteria bacterium]|nr:alpha/beta hydrolase [Alphaproteobacteria bacterium]
MTTSLTVRAGDLELHAEVFGDEGPGVLLIMGLGAQMLLWPERFCEKLAATGLRVVRFDNRDVGLSTRMTHLGVPSLPRMLARSRLGLPVESPYSLNDMAEDALAVAEATGLDRPLVVGASMGGMIAQRLATLAPERIAGVVSVMSSTSAHFWPRPGTLAALVRKPAPGRQGYVDHTVMLFRAMGTKSLEVHEDELRDLAGRCFDRGASPDGFLRHFAAILADGDRASTLGGVDLPRLVVHGDEDTLIPLDCGVRTAQAMRAPLRIVRGMGHDLPPQRWDEIVGAISGLVPR